jgi:hypothetical protein
MYQENTYESMQDPSVFTAQNTSAMAEPLMRHPIIKPIIPSKYSGKRDVTTLDSWINSVDAYFALSHAQPPYIYYSLSTLLEGEASVWFRYNYPVSQASTLTWETVRPTLRTYFTPVNYLRQLQNQYTTLRQNNTVSEYTMRFSEIIMQLAANNILIPNTMLLHQYIQGLKFTT